jgi:hypothetical protein
MSEVCSVVDVSQFAEPGHSTDKCGFYSVSLLHHAAKPGVALHDTSDIVASWADDEYVKYDGADVSSNFNGMTMGILFNVLADAGLHYQVIGSTELALNVDHLTVASIRAWLALGYPVIVAVAENAVYDFDLAGSPYAWDTTGLFHVITITGIGDHNTLLCHDTASIAPNGVRPGPRKYNATSLQQGLISATAIVMPWLQRPPDGYDALQGGPMIPLGWSDDGTTLMPPDKSHKVTLGFREAILASTNWNAGNVPREDARGMPAQVEMHANTGPGTRQIFRDCMLVWTAQGGVKTSAAGDEIMACYATIAAQAAQIATLQAQLKAAQMPVVTTKIDTAGAVAALSVISTAANGIVATLPALNKALGVQ